MSESALDRTARALDLVPYLLEHQGISIPDLAAAFSVSEKQINDDLVLIHMCGLPGYTPLELIDMFYEDGYVTVSDPQSFKKPRSMNKIEMTSLLVSLDLLKSLKTDEVAQEIETLKLKLQENMRFENPFVVVQSIEKTEKEEVLERAIGKSTPLRIDYASGTKDTSSVREILPLEIYVANGSTYLNAWCQTSKDDRTFRLDRILSYEVIDGTFVNQAPVQIPEPDNSPPIVLLLAKAARNFIEDNRAIIRQTADIRDGEQIRAELNPIDREWLVRTILGFGGKIEVSEPKDLASEIRSRALAIKDSYGG